MRRDVKLPDSKFKVGQVLALVSRLILPTNQSQVLGEARGWRTNQREDKCSAAELQAAGCTSLRTTAVLH